MACKTATSITVEKQEAGVTCIRVPASRSASWEQWFLLSSDRHHDNPKSNQELEAAHLKEARERGAMVLDFGDLFCAMQGKYDPRGRKADIRPEHNVEGYLDSLVNTAADFYGPYADLFALISHGNHETSILRKLETDLTQRLIALLNARGGTNVVFGGYHGYIQFRFCDANGGHSQTVTLKYHHGHGGGGPVTKGTIQANRRAVIYPDADIVATGHIHEHWTMEYTQERISQRGRVTCRPQVHVSLPTYKEEFHGNGGGYHIEGGRPPKPIGAVWLRFSYRADQGVVFDLSRAR